ncbi:MAG: hypothetical protein JOZ42_02060 [Acetobacteraceae bacterium]|nr:hypothetical protein [Acetobacteraceae bacterium]
MFALSPESQRRAVRLMLVCLTLTALAGQADAQTGIPPAASVLAAPGGTKPKQAPKPAVAAAPSGPAAKPGAHAHAKPPVHQGKAAALSSGQKKPAAAPPANAPAPPPPPPSTEAQKPPEPAKGTTGLPLPRFAALRSDEVNMRAGPGTRYPIDWVYKRRDLPVEIDREFEVWRLIRDSEGTKGWVHQATLSGRRTLIVMGDIKALHKEADPQSPIIAELKPGVLGRIKSCDSGSDWCQVQVSDYRGFLKRSDFWGTEPGEAVAN